MPTDDPAAADGAATIAITWTFTQTYTDQIPLDALARASGCRVGELAADPESLLGVVGEQLTHLLTGHQYAHRVVGVPEVEIVTAEFADTLTLAQLVDAARTALRAETDAGQPTHAGQALAALLAGLRREGISDR